MTAGNARQVSAREIDGWTVTAYPTGAVYKVIATYPHPSGKGKLAIHVEKLSAEQVVTSSTRTARWGGPMAPVRWTRSASITEALAS